MTRSSKVVLLLCVVLAVALFLETVSARVSYQYKKYTYRKKRDDKIYKNAKQPCEVNPDCLSRRGAEQAICIRKCVSEFCYQDIYAADELEEGEIDVRLNSFKGCVAQKK
ncbi:uncharacterized protein LOC127874105 [Dreissena polymorpha]|uniref:Uncharacterized protein n=1 Tax=Dreissena polymorpha TaxID=45954 RepID=A0A9D4KZC3_DREPO|nr:uncharacterized protein LOC127874105 [Dreissena polymorpha]XP_052274205.1 uncharacterized protein LOC127874105 [Dreissena polymorpha]XP_052274206.1 uncharacterized protein LOC127874105 [Dreissena polymorpha]KAH3848945.1 hypothetical protein DPMN_091330 [Dreissena polymorpha]